MTGGWLIPMETDYSIIFLIIIVLYIKDEKNRVTVIY